MNEEGIIESGMRFNVPAHTFCIEKDPFWKDYKGMKSCEFVYYDVAKKQSVFIEAKSSIAKYERPTSPKDAKDITTANQAFYNEIDKIVQKFHNSVNGLFGILNKHKGEDVYKRLPDFVKSEEFIKSEFRLYLVIKHHPKSCPIDIQDILQNKLSILCHEWNIPSTCVKVMNATKALSKNIITEIID